MGKRMRIRVLGITVLLILSVSLGMTTYASEEDKRVLFISSYSYAWESVQKQIQGIEQGLDEAVILDYEFMDTRRVYDETSVQLFYEELKYRLESGDPYDVVILGDDAALLFAMEYREELFAGIPLLFLGVNDEQLALDASEDPLVTGVIEKLPLEMNIELGLKLNPNAKKVYAILDNSPTGKAERKKYYECAERYGQLEFKEINASELSTINLRIAMGEIEEDSILLYITSTKGSDGNEYSEMEAIKLYTQYSKVPVMRTVEAGIGDGLLGGYVVSMQEAGKEVAKMAMSIIQGTDPSTIDVVKDGTNLYMLDESVMRQYEMDVSLIPDGAVVVNKTPSYIEMYGEILRPAGGLLIVMLIIILYFSYDNVKRRKLLQELEEARTILEAASQHDFLTKLPNRSKFREDFERLVAEQRPCTIFMLDIDDFKSINDTYGHTAGDEVLQQLAGRLKAMHSQLFTSYRFAGDEFIMILKSNQSKIVNKSAWQCREVFDKAFTVCGKKMKVGGSIGIACYPDDATNPEQLVVCADNAMYHVKKSGKNTYAFYRELKEKEK